MYNMDLFAELAPAPINIIEHDGIVEYYGMMLSYQQADDYFEKLLTQIQWKHDQANIQGQFIVTARKVAWYGDQPFHYTYSNTTKVALPWTAELLQLKQLVEQQTGYQFNACLLNLYHSGEEGMTWHSDAEKDLQKNGAIASVSLGAERKFSFKHKYNQQTLSVLLQHGSLLVMRGETQSHWLHRLPPTKKISTARINLTFRMINQRNINQPSIY